MATVRLGQKNTQTDFWTCGNVGGKALQLQYRWEENCKPDEKPQGAPHRNCGALMLRC